MTAAFAYGYDWLHDVWTDDQLASLRSTMIEFGLSLGVQAYTNMNCGWWSNDIQGNWNCVCNSGLTMGALAILGEDTTGTAEQILALSIPNAQTNCVFGVSSDGTWSETANYCTSVRPVLLRWHQRSRPPLGQISVCSRPIPISIRLASTTCT